MMMMVPLVVVAVLASMGGYHYRTLAASQGQKKLEEETESLDEGVIDLEATVGESARLPADDLFADFTDKNPSSTQAENTEAIHSHTTTVPTHNAEISNHSPQHHQKPQNDGSRRYPSAALEGWQFADARPDNDDERAPTQNVKETENRPTNFSGIQAAIDARRNQQAELVAVAETSSAEETPSAAETEETLEDDLIEAKPVAEAYRRNSNSEPRTTPEPAQKRHREPRTLKEATVVLQELGIRKYRLEPEADGERFRFRCAITDPHNPRVRNLFTAVEDEPLAAVIRVLRQVEEWRAEH